MCIPSNFINILTHFYILFLFLKVKHYLCSVFLFHLTILYVFFLKEKTIIGIIFRLDRCPDITEFLV